MEIRISIENRDRFVRRTKLASTMDTFDSWRRKFRLKTKREKRTSLFFSFSLCRSRRIRFSPLTFIKIESSTQLDWSFVFSMNFSTRLFSSNRSEKLWFNGKLRPSKYKKYFVFLTSMEKLNFIEFSWRQANNVNLITLKRYLSCENSSTQR